MTRIARYVHRGAQSFGFVSGDRVVDRSVVPGFSPTTVREFLASGEGAPMTEGLPTIPLADVTLLVPVELGKVVCAGVNFPTHRAEANRSTERPEWPTLFTRFPDSHVAPGEDLLKPEFSDRFDYEGEPAVVIGTRAWRVSKDEAMSHVWGYSVYNDGSVRDWQSQTRQWTPGKNFYRSGSLGPVLVSKDEVGDIYEQDMETRVNGEVRQHASLSEMLFNIADLIEHISTWTPLEPGDVIAAGTSGGVGMFMEPSGFLRKGDIVEVEIPAVGILRNGVTE